MKLEASLISLMVWVMLLILPVKASELTDAAEVVVIVNTNNPVTKLTPREVSDIFLARRRLFPSGDFMTVIEQGKNSQLREKFFHLLNSMTLKQVNAYWARLQFSGEVQPPVSLENSESVLDEVKHDTSAIGYVDASAIDDSVRVILKLGDTK